MHWYHSESSAAIGWKSNFSSIVAAIYGVTSNDSNSDPFVNIPDKQRKRLRQMYQIMSRLPPEIKRALDACYNPVYQDKYPLALRKVYGSKTGCVLFTSHAKDLTQLLRLTNKKLSSKLSEEEKVLAFKIGDEAAQLWHRIHTEYLRVKREVCG